MVVQVSTIATKSTFSTRGLVSDYFWSSLCPKMVEALICGQSWLSVVDSDLTMINKENDKYYVNFLDDKEIYDEIYIDIVSYKIVYLNSYF